MTLMKKNHYKPKYKKFLRLKLNFKTTKIFNKKKWKNLPKIKKKNKLFNNNLFFLSSYSNNYKNKFRINLHMKQKITLFYGGLSQKYLKLVLKNTLKNFKLKKNLLFVNLFFINFIELRLDTVLYRSGFALSFRRARQYINHGYILVNNIIVKNSSYLLKKGDFVTISKKYKILIKNFIFIKSLQILSTKHLQINYKTFQIIIIDNLYNYNTSIYYPFWFNINFFSNYYF